MYVFVPTAGKDTGHKKTSLQLVFTAWSDRMKQNLLVVESLLCGALHSFCCGVFPQRKKGSEQVNFVPVSSAYPRCTYRLWCLHVQKVAYRLQSTVTTYYYWGYTTQPCLIHNTAAVITLYLYWLYQMMWWTHLLCTNPADVYACRAAFCSVASCLFHNKVKTKCEGSHLEQDAVVSVMHVKVEQQPTGDHPVQIGLHARSCSQSELRRAFLKVKCLQWHINPLRNSNSCKEQKALNSCSLWLLGRGLCSLDNFGESHLPVRHFSKTFRVGIRTLGHYRCHLFRVNTVCAVLPGRKGHRLF